MTCSKTTFNETMNTISTNEQWTWLTYPNKDCFTIDGPRHWDALCTSTWANLLPIIIDVRIAVCKSRTYFFWYVVDDGVIWFCFALSTCCSHHFTCVVVVVCVVDGLVDWAKCDTHRWREFSFLFVFGRLAVWFKFINWRVSHSWTSVFFLPRCLSQAKQSIARFSHMNLTKSTPSITILTFTNFIEFSDHRRSSNIININDKSACLFSDREIVDEIQLIRLDRCRFGDWTVSGARHLDYKFGQMILVIQRTSRVDNN